MCVILGMVVREEGERDPDARVLLTNHVSVIDHTAVELVRPCVLVRHVFSVVFFAFDLRV